MRSTFAPLGLFLTLIAIPAARADVVTDWNQTALKTLADVKEARTLPASRALAMVHIAIYDAANTVNRRYTPYAYDAKGATGASVEAAVATAAHTVLVALFPGERANLDAARDASLKQAAAGVQQSDGVAIGRVAAERILALRAADPAPGASPYTLAAAPGVWQPATGATAFGVGWGKVTPFGLKSAVDFRAPGPPKLNSPEYAADFDHAKSLGAANSAARTAEQTDIGRFWLENSQISWNVIARTVALQKQTGVVENARLFALLNIAGADATIVAMDTKYTFNFWRPVAAIAAAETDGNDQTVADPAWTPLVAAQPAHPDYTSLHAAYSAAAAAVLADVFGGDNLAFSALTSTAPRNEARAYTSLSQATAECAASRVYIGYHFRTATLDGLRQGEQVGRWIVGNLLRPVP